MRLESQLKAIIEAQVKGRKHPDEQKYAGMPLEIDDFGIVTMDGAIIPVLSILLDTKGCKSAYGEDPQFGETIHMDGMLAEKVGIGHWTHVSCMILKDWHSGEGNNWKAAIETAYNLLPKE